MKQPNKKEAFVLKNYKEIIEHQEFDEHDIVSFLIYIRSFFETSDKNKYWNIYDICNFVAHRGRDSGKTQKGIVTAINNNYQTKINSKAIEGYDGIRAEKWKDEWEALGKELGISKPSARA